jgi:hypothetical protein
MRHEDAGLSLWIAADDAARGRALDASRTELHARGSAGRSIRRRLGGACIALGERLAGEPRPVTRRRLAGQAS